MIDSEFIRIHWLKKAPGPFCAKSVQSRVGYQTVSMSGELLLLLDFVFLVISTFLSMHVYTYFQPGVTRISAAGINFVQMAWIFSILGALIIYDGGIGAIASRGQLRALARTFVLRYTIFIGAILTLGSISQTLQDFPPNWLVCWLLAGFLLTSASRLTLFFGLHHLQHRGVLSEAIAVVGAGPVADRLVYDLQKPGNESIELLGIFDDDIPGAADCKFKATGDISQLLELGKHRKIDWILMTLPPAAEHRLAALTHRLKALSVPIGLCPQHVDLEVPYRRVDYVGNSVPVSLLATRPMGRWDAAIMHGECFLPRWTITALLVPLAAMVLLTRTLARRLNATAPASLERRSLQLDAYELPEFIDVAAHFGEERYGYVVTPNADHLIRFHDNAEFRTLYAAASYVLLDSQFVAHLMRFTTGIRLPVCTGSDLTEKLFSEIISTDDRVVIIGASSAQIDKLRGIYGLRNLVHFNPPMGFMHDAAAVADCLSFIEIHSPYRFCLLAVGSPQQEVLARQLQLRGVARGLTLCIGASINFLTGDERRAPSWLQRCGMEWLFRLTQAPSRMVHRYLIRGPRIFRLLRSTDIVLRNHALPSVIGPLEPDMPATNVTPAFATDHIPKTPTERKERSHGVMN